MSRRLIDVTEHLLNANEEFDFVGDKFFSSFKGKFFKDASTKRTSRKGLIDLYADMDRRRLHALRMFRTEPNKSVFDVAVISLLPVRVVRQLKVESDKRNAWLSRNYLDGFGCS